MTKIYYRGEYKYQVYGDYSFDLPPEFPEVEYSGRFLEVHGRTATMKDGYAGDGPSGPTVDTKTFMRGAWQHDATYQLFREGVYDISLRKRADTQLIETCKEDGMNWARRQWVYAGVRLGGERSALTTTRKEILEAGT